MIKKVYILSGKYGDNCFFNEHYLDHNGGIIRKAMAKRWKEFKVYNPITLELSRSDTGKKL